MDMTSSGDILAGYGDISSTEKGGEKQGGQNSKLHQKCFAILSQDAKMMNMIHI